MRNPIVECVPNLSVGRDRFTVSTLVAAIDAVTGADVWHVDIGDDANRTVVTFGGEPEAVLEAAFRLQEAATEYIDMSKHNGAHPRIGAVDVCPFVPIRSFESNGFGINPSTVSNDMSF